MKKYKSVTISLKDEEGKEIALGFETNDMSLDRIVHSLRELFRSALRELDPEDRFRLDVTKRPSSPSLTELGHEHLK